MPVPPTYTCDNCGESSRVEPTTKRVDGDPMDLCLGCSQRVCQLCGGTFDTSETHQHHASYIYSILVTVCEECHTRIHYEDGFHDNLNPEIPRSLAEEWNLDSIRD